MTTIYSTNIYSPTALSPVQQLLDQQKAAASSADSTSTNSTSTDPSSTSTDYTDQDWYITAKVAQLKGQIATYSTLPGLDPSGSIIDSLTKQVNDLVTKQNAKLKTAQDAAAAQQAKLAQQTKQAAIDAQIPDVSTMLQRAQDGANGVKVTAYTPPDTTQGASDGTVLSSDDMLAHARGGTVNTTA